MHVAVAAEEDSVGPNLPAAQGVPEHVVLPAVADSEVTGGHTTLIRLSKMIVCVCVCGNEMKYVNKVWVQKRGRTRPRPASEEKKTTDGACPAVGRKM